MSKNQKHNKHKKPVAKPLLGDHSAKRKELLINIAFFSVLAVIMFAWVIPATFNENTPPAVEDPFPGETILPGENSEELILTYTRVTRDKKDDVNVISVWFRIHSVATRGTITFDPNIGGVFKANMSNKEIIPELVTEVSIEDTSEYEFVWTINCSDEELDVTNYSMLSIVLENVAIRKESGIYLVYSKSQGEFLTQENFEKLLKEIESAQ
jgi:hypothetical protein